jgi:transposase InsO family protein
MEQKIIDTFREHKRRYGSRRISKSLGNKGEKASRYKVSKTLRQYGLKAIQPRSFVPKTTNSRHTYQISPNLLLDRPKPGKPNEIWVGDITFIPLSGSNWCYLSVFMDLFSRRIVGWQLDDNMKETLVTATLNKAIGSRKINKDLIIHSDRGGQYGGKMFRAIIKKRKMLQSMSRADNPYDNAFMESCFSRFKAELLQDGIFETIEDAQTEIFEYIEMYYNTLRLHSSLDYQSPDEYEKQFEKNGTFEMHKQEDSALPKESVLIL